MLPERLYELKGLSCAKISRFSLTCTSVSRIYSGARHCVISAIPKILEQQNYANGASKISRRIPINNSEIKKIKTSLAARFFILWDYSRWHCVFVCLSFLPRSFPSSSAPWLSCFGVIFFHEVIQPHQLISNAILRDKRREYSITESQAFSAKQGINETYIRDSEIP